MTFLSAYVSGTGTERADQAKLRRPQLCPRAKMQQRRKPALPAIPS